MRELRQTPLGRHLAVAIGERGPITFADYMRIALYEPGAGYYTSEDRARAGWRGDFITSVDLHPLFGAAVGRQLAEIWDLMGRPAPVVGGEDGAGRGLLARAPRAGARDPSSDAPAGFAGALAFRERDVGRVWQVGAPLSGDDLAPHVILSNELIDALPAHVVERTAGGLAEVYVDVAGEPPALVERLGPPSSEAVATYLDRYAIPWRDFAPGWRAEIALAAEQWMADAARRLGPRGCVITIDYGDRARRLYASWRRRGTLLCYHSHETSENPLELTGEQDITTHVNFSALIAVGRACGLRLAALTTQRDWLLALGLADEAEALGRRLFPLADSERHTDAGQRDYLRRMSLKHAVAALVDPRGMGGFRVLAQHRGLPGVSRRLKARLRSPRPPSSVTPLPFFREGEGSGR